jgi:acyl-[acyl-carrier-protein] desaturase
VERTIHHLIANGFNPRSANDPYNLLVYTSFQERATRLSHGYVGRIAGREGDATLARICGLIVPGRFMDDGRDPDLFDHFAIVAQRANVYTVRDYASIIEHFVKTWNIAGRTVSGKAAQAQHELCRQAERYERLADRTSASLESQAPMTFSWLRDRKV